MNRGVRIFLALTILLGGLAAAWMFQQDSSPADQPAHGDHERLVRRAPLEQPTPAGEASPLPLVRLEASRPAPRRVPLRNPLGVLAPMDPGEPPPPLARSYPRDDLHVALHWGAALGLGPTSRDRPGDPQAQSGAPADGPRVHTIVDGDTLRGLAQRYLGSADRFLELYEANRDVLPGPELLPIGAELKIPPQHQAARPDPSPAQQERAKN